jgi:hypothetical protein
MGADFCYMLLPYAELTDARERELLDSVTDEDFDEDDCYDRDDFVSAVAEYPALWGDREVAEIEIKGDLLCMITGGMTWGDVPTDAYETMRVLDSVTGVWECLERWQRADVENEAAAKAEEEAENDKEWD